MNSLPIDAIKTVRSFAECSDMESLATTNARFRSIIGRPSSLVREFLRDFKDICDDYNQEIYSLDHTSPLSEVHDATLMMLVRLASLAETSLTFGLTFVESPLMVQQTIDQWRIDLDANVTAMKRMTPESFKQREHAFNAWSILRNDSFTIIRHLVLKWKYFAKVKFCYDESEYYLPSLSHLCSE